MIKRFTLAFLSLILVSSSVMAQDIDSAQIGKEYPYILPILGKKAYARGYRLQKPFGLMAGTLFNKQGIVLKDFELGIADPGTPVDDVNFVDLSEVGIFEFGPSEGRITTVNARADAWILPFLNIGGFYGRVGGEQTITFRLGGPDNDLIASTTDIDGQYYGFNMLGVAPVGPVNLMIDYSWAWTTNVNLDKPVLVKVSGMRIVRRIMTKTPDRFVAVWLGAQFQNLDNQTSGNIAFDEALGISDEDKQKMDDYWMDVQNDVIPIDQDDMGNDIFWSELGPVEQRLREATFNLFRGFVDDNAYYKFTKELEYNWNMLLGVNYQHNPRWQVRAEYGFLRSKQQLMFGLNYRFGL